VRAVVVTSFHSEAEDHMFEELVRENPKRSTEGQIEYLERINQLAAERMTWRRDEAR
jgi:hypothetical protein